MSEASTAAPRRSSGNPPDRNLALELVRVTEAAAMGAGRWIGRGDKEAADQAAVDAMRVLFPEAVALVSAARQGFMQEG